ncbi:hypothetical protein [Streptomyces sp. NPDC096033]|uniref:hypothetical protein n=1 Tax=Streptomyces sp. NPDC096033 TaxID=3366071 RepID=UPI00380D80A5
MGAARWEAYANDQASPDTLIAASAASNRSEADKHPAEWLPSDGSYHCTYAATWVGTKLRWNLAVDDTERQPSRVLETISSWVNSASAAMTTQVSARTRKSS